MIECTTCGFCYEVPENSVFDTVCPYCGELLILENEFEEGDLNVYARAY